MKSGRSIQDVSREILRQQEAKADYLVATDRLHMDTWGDSPVIRVLDREGIYRPRVDDLSLFLKTNILWMKYVVAILTGLATAIPLVVKLVEYVQKAVKEKNWNKLLDLVMSLMEEAEKKFEDGATRKEWVMAMVKSSADSINYDIDMEAVSELIESLCEMSKIVNKENAADLPAENAGKVGD